MASNLVFSAALAACFIITHSITPSPAFPEYSYRDHPLYKFPAFRSTRPRPVIMERYYVHRSDRRTTMGSRFIASIATYSLFADHNASYCEKLDALLLPTSRGSVAKDGSFAKIHLTAAARVIVLLHGSAISFRRLRDRPPTTVTGLPGWSAPTALYGETHREPLAQFDHPNRLPLFGVAVEKSFPAGAVIKLFRPQDVRVDGAAARKVTVLFARPGTGTPRSFGPPALPTLSAVRSILPTVRALETPEPNARCPDWLHDIHVVENQDEEAARSHREPTYFKTWHPVIDSVYWCYFGHGHGAFPGHFRPPFGYTAFKTPDEKTSHGRQEESHRGFKIFAFALPGDKQVVVATLHAQLSEARRFKTRRHTLMTAVFGVFGSRWSKQVELRMKMDLGGAQFTREKSGTESITSADKKIEEELAERRIKAGRRFNIINEKLTSGSDPVRDRVYEQWKGPLNTCSAQASGRWNSGFDFDFRDAASGLRDLSLETSDSNMPFFEKRFSMNQLLVIRHGVRIAKDVCDFDESMTAFKPESGGVFYTDPFFAKILPGSGRFAVRQFWHPRVPEVLIPEGRAVASDVWSGHMVYVKTDKEKKMRFENVEGAVDARLN